MMNAQAAEMWVMEVVIPEKEEGLHVPPIPCREARPPGNPRLLVT